MAGSLREYDMMDEHPSYHESITSEEAEKRLRKYKKRRCYLTRFSESNTRYILSVYQQKPTETIKHFKLKIEEGLAQVEGKKTKFENIGRLLEHYQSHRVDPAFRNIGIAYTEHQYERDCEEKKKGKCCNVL